MTLEDLEALSLDTISTETITEYVTMLVSENENIKNQMTGLLDRQDRVANTWGNMILILNSRAEKQNVE